MHYLTIFNFENFIDFESVQNKEETLRHYARLAFFKKLINVSEGRTYLMKYKVHETELYDDRINLLGLSEPKKINYLNLEEYIQEFE